VQQGEQEVPHARISVGQPSGATQRCPILDSAPELAIRECAVKGESTQPVKVRSKEVSVGLGSYPGDGEGDQSIEAPGTETRLGGFASVRAATRVKPEQASKGKVRAPSPLSKDEGRRGRPDAPTRDGRPARRGSGRSTYARADSQHGKPVGLSGRPGNASIGSRARQASEGLIRPENPGNAGGGKEPWFGVRFNELRGGDWREPGNS
jgi:hypothetical protein